MKKCITSNQEGVAGIIIVIGALLLLVVGGLAGSMVPDMLKKNVPDVKPTVAFVEPTLIPEEGPSVTPTEEVELSNKTGVIEGALTYPAGGIPDDVGACAELASDTNIKICGKQIKDKKYKTGVGFKLEVESGVYYVYAFRGDKKAYYNQFVLCGLNISCKDRTKIPVPVKAGQETTAMPDDWYDESVPTPKPTLKLLLPKITIYPSATPTGTKLIINPNILQKITFPSATPTPIKINLDLGL